MRRVVCPECGDKVMLSPEEQVLYTQVECDACGAILEVVQEEPLKVKAVEDNLASDDDDDD